MPGPVHQSVQQQVVESEHARQRRIARAWAHYYDDSPRALPIAADGIDDNVRLNFAELIVDTGVGYLFGRDGTPLTFTVAAEGTEDEDDDARRQLDLLWTPERRAVQLGQLGVNGGVAGHAFARLTRQGRVIVWDPSNVSVDWDDEDIESVLEYTNQWTAVDRTTGKAYVRRQRVFPEGAGWVILDEESRGDGESWVELGREAWPVPWAPVFHCQNLPAPNEFWGRADLEPDVLDLIEAVEAIAGYMRKLVRQQGAPLPYVTGEQASKLEHLNVQLGRLLAIPNEQARVGQLELKGDLGAARQLYVELKAALHELARIPEVATGKLENVGNLSGLALGILYGPLVEKTGTKRSTYGPMLNGLSRGLLELAGSGGLTVAPSWPAVVPHDEQGEVSALEADRRMGIVSKQTASEKRGYDWTVEQDRLQEEAEAGAEAMAAAIAAGAVGPSEEDDEEEEPVE